MSTVASPVVSGYWFAKVPEWVVYHPDLDGNAVRAYAVLDRHAGADCFPALATIAKLMNVSEDTARRAYRKLIDVGAVKVEKRYTDAGRQTSNRYILAGDNPHRNAPVQGRGSRSATHGGGTDATDGGGTGATRTRARTNHVNTAESVVDSSTRLSGSTGATPQQERFTHKPPAELRSKLKKVSA